VPSYKRIRALLKGPTYKGRGKGREEKEGGKGKVEGGEGRGGRGRGREGREREGREGRVRVHTGTSVFRISSPEGRRRRSMEKPNI